MPRGNFLKKLFSPGGLVARVLGIHSPTGHELGTCWCASSFENRLSDIDKNARAYGYEVGRGNPITETMGFSPDNPFLNDKWRENIKSQ